MRILSRKELNDLPPVTWLIKNYIPSESMVLLWGLSETFKSFVALSIAGAVATGRDWLDFQPVSDPGDVLFIAAEGRRGVTARVEAWEAQQRTLAKRLFVIDHPVTFSEFDDLLLKCKSKPCNPRLVVVDTLSRCFAGTIDENSASSTEKFLFQVDRLRQEYGASIILVHHSGKTGEWPRGSYAVKAACDAEFEVQREEGSMVCRVINKKMKDSEHAPSLALLARSMKDSLCLDRA